MRSAEPTERAYAMSDKNFEDPQSFLASSMFSYLAPQDTEWCRKSAVAKRFPSHFIVRERVPGFADRHLSIGRESDYPVEVLETPRHADSVVVATLVKERLVTWAAIDWLADLLSKVLRRKIWPEQIRHSGLKDRWAITGQTIVIFGVTVDELKSINWPHTPGKTGFFLKDIHWHDGRCRVHPHVDPKRNRVYTEVSATVLTERKLSKEELLDRIRQHVNKWLARELKPQNLSLKGHGQTLQIQHVTASEIAAIDWPENLGVSLKDVRLYKSAALSKGDHRQNRFELKVLVRGEDSCAELQNYLNPLMERLERFSFCIPNAVNWQRLAARQLGHLHGYTLITGDYNPPAGVHAFGSASEAALYRFLHEVSGRENPAAEQLRREIEPCWLYDFSGMKQRLARSYRQLNMSVEYKVVERLADTDRYRGDFQEVVRSMSEEVSMWVAAWQSWWWNHVLVRKLPGWIREMEEAASTRERLASSTCTCSQHKGKGSDKRQAAQGETDAMHKRLQSKLPVCARCNAESRARRLNPLQKGIPLLMDTPQAREYFGRLPYCREALEQLDKADPFVRGQFLTPRGNTPWRKAFIRIDGLNYTVGKEQVDGVEENVVNLQFELPSGAYATTFLGLLFELEEPNKQANRNGASSADDAVEVVEETE